MMPRSLRGHHVNVCTNCRQDDESSFTSMWLGTGCLQAVAVHKQGCGERASVLSFLWIMGSKSLPSAPVRFLHQPGHTLRSPNAYL